MTDQKRTGLPPFPIVTPQIKPFDSQHASKLLELLNQEGWDYTTDDLLRLATIEPKGCLFLLDEQDSAIGYLTALAFQPLGLIGNVVTDKRHRGAGVGKKLMQEALTYLEGRDCPTQRLFSYSHTAGFYHQLGFEAMGITTTLRGQTQQLDSAPGAIIYEASMRSELLQLDRSLLGYDRSSLLDRLLDEFGSQTWVSLDEAGGLDGYLIASGKPSGRTEVTYEIGPWIAAQGCRNWRSLLETALSRLHPQLGVELSIVTDNHRVLNLCRQLGFTETFSTLDMLRGEPLELPEKNVIARAGLVKG